MDWGTVPAYFGGFALLVTAGTLWRDYRERARDQANKVAAWVKKGLDGEDHQVLLKNASDLPCTAIAVAVTEGYKRQPKLSLSKMFGHSTDRYRWYYIHAVGPDETLILRQTPIPVAVRHLEFTDAAGRKWARRENSLIRRRTTWFRIIHEPTKPEEISSRTSMDTAAKAQSPDQNP
ncbi:hypothetical protein [Mycobacterium riyadhense]|uniref:hypothetical protein n=1 Tax=Mycobacterium riyadhense TaxID=486698 RepID=UPI0019560837|nr:hypothetical protein [Mycobacterium riyadhense]